MAAALSAAIPQERKLLRLLEAALSVRWASAVSRQAPCDRARGGGPWAERRAPGAERVTTAWLLGPRGLGSSLCASLDEVLCWPPLAAGDRIDEAPPAAGSR